MSNLQITQKIGYEIEVPDQYFGMIFVFCKYRVAECTARRKKQLRKLFLAAASTKLRLVWNEHAQILLNEAALPNLSMPTACQI